MFNIVNIVDDKFVEVLDTSDGIVETVSQEQLVFFARQGIEIKGYSDSEVKVKLPSFKRVNLSSKLGFIVKELEISDNIVNYSGTLLYNDVHSVELLAKRGKVKIRGCNPYQVDVESIYELTDVLGEQLYVDASVTHLDVLRNVCPYKYFRWLRVLDVGNQPYQVFNLDILADNNEFVDSALNSRYSLWKILEPVYQSGYVDSIGVK